MSGGRYNGKSGQNVFPGGKILGTHTRHLAGGEKKEGRKIRSC